EFRRVLFRSRLRTLLQHLRNAEDLVTDVEVEPVVEQDPHLSAALRDGALERAPRDALDVPALPPRVDLVPDTEAAKVQLEGGEPTVVRRPRVVDPDGTRRRGHEARNAHTAPDHVQSAHRPHGHSSSCASGPGPPGSSWSAGAAPVTPAGTSPHGTGSRCSSCRTPLIVFHFCDSADACAAQRCIVDVSSSASRSITTYCGRGRNSDSSRSSLWIHLLSDYFCRSRSLSLKLLL